MYPTRSYLVARIVLLALAALLALLWCVGVVSADTIRLKPVGLAQAPVVRLADVAWLDGPYAEHLGGLAIAEFDAATDGHTLTLAELRDALSRRGVNWARLSLKGVARCKIDFNQDGARDVPGGSLPVVLRPTPVAGWDRITPDADAGIAAVVDQPVTTRGALTVRELLAERIGRWLGVADESLIVSFTERDADKLDQSTVAARFEIEPEGPPRLGRVRFTVRRITGLGQAESFTVSVELAQRVLAVVATVPISRGDRLTPNNMALKAAIIEDLNTPRVTDWDAVLGAVTDATLRPGDVIRSDQLSTPQVVRRGDVVTVQVAVGSVRLHTDGFAEGDAAVGQPVAVRLDRKRGRDARVVTAVAVGPGLVRVTAAGPAHDVLAAKE